MLTKLVPFTRKFWVRSPQFWKLSPPDRAQFLQAAFTLIVATLCLRVLGLRRSQLLLRKWPSKVGIPAISIAQSGPNAADRPPEDSLKIVYCLCQWHQVAIRNIPFQANCLERSLALWWLLQRYGVSTSLQIGVSKESGQFKAHAWVRWQQRILNDHAEIEQVFADFGQPIVPPHSPI
ncbi:MAG: lasso peptide biosynthesis B2 protein [Leptolyngbyaceae cyanobacterium bins.59]|nr:lasso peptide biosynthesis B2 protein [Leptolyngbyaceae cyanobacterium bins.59]